jgi:hypothetical protein
VDKPDQRLFEADLASAEFRAGALKGYWGVAGTDDLPEPPAWPARILWVAAAPRSGAPDRYFLRLDLADYRSVPPTGTFWDLTTDAMLEVDKRPKGRADSRVAKVFRTDWEGGRGFYHPYDRLAAAGHPKWVTEQPSLIWDSKHTIIDFLEEIHSLLTSGDYLGLSA